MNVDTVTHFLIKEQELKIAASCESLVVKL